MRKTALLLLALVWALGCFAQAGAEPTVYTDATNAYQYTLNTDGTAALVLYVAEPIEENVTIPSMVDGHTVTSVTASTFAAERCAGIVSLAIPDSVITIESNPFYECASLTTIIVSTEHPLFAIQDGALIDQVNHVLVAYPRGLSNTSFTVPEGVTSIGSDAFYKNDVLTSVTLPEGVRFIQAEAFGWCSALTDVNLPSTVTAIRAYGFAACSSLTNLTIASSVTTMEEGAFQHCNSLTITCTAGSAAEKYCQENGLPYLSAE